MDVDGMQPHSHRLPKGRHGHDEMVEGEWVSRWNTQRLICTAAGAGPLDALHLAERQGCRVSGRHRGHLDIDEARGQLQKGPVGGAEMDDAHRLWRAS